MVQGLGFWLQGWLGCSVVFVGMVVASDRIAAHVAEILWRASPLKGRMSCRSCFHGFPYWPLETTPVVPPHNYGYLGIVKPNSGYSRGNLGGGGSIDAGSTWRFRVLINAIMTVLIAQL